MANDPYISMELLLQLLFLFEGLSVWKLYKFSVSTVDQMPDMKDKCLANVYANDSISNDNKLKEANKIHKSCRLFLWINWTLRILNYSMIAWLLLIVLSAGIWDLTACYKAYSLKFTWIVFLFMSVKLLFLLIGYRYNPYFMKKYKDSFDVEPQDLDVVSKWEVMINKRFSKPSSKR